MVKGFFISAFGLLICFAAFADQRKEQEFFDRVWTDINNNCRGSKKFMQCKADNSPSKCKALAFGSDASAWAGCVRSCGNAGFLSRSVGECS